MSPKRILLGHLGKRGDCLYATAVARQIKQDFPDCSLTWAISSMCRSLIDGNPSVDEVWELPFTSGDAIIAGWKQFEAEAVARKRRGDYDEIYLTQVHPGNFQNYDGTVRSSIFRGYPKPITVPVQPIVRLSEQEVDRVRRFAEEHKLQEHKPVILFECASSSGQSFVDSQYAVAVARQVLRSNPGACFILSSNQAVPGSDGRLIDGSILSFKENAELTKYCTLLVGCSSGISWLATSDWAKPLPTVQLLRADTMMFASMVHDARHFGLPTGHILEMTDCKPGHVASCVQLILDSGFAPARKKYHQEIPVDFTFYFKQLYWESFRTDEWVKGARSLGAAMDRFGRVPQLVDFMDKVFFPCLDISSLKISKEDRDLISGLLQHKQHSRTVPALFRNIASLAKIAGTLFRKDMFVAGSQVLVKILKSFT